MATIFETETCGRCGGSGHYSFNQMDGTRCYGCGGTGIRYTKRGLAARNYYDQIRSVPATEVKAGDRVFMGTAMGGGNRWQTVKFAGYRERGAAVTDNGENPYIWIETDSVNHGVFAGTMVIKAHSPERLAELQAQALAYQESLTKVGKPRKQAA